ncbi:hypothetical protein UNDYM_1869 [Undibacterium sp. YM2]|uniref:DUF1398 family protein n=1 Tax=Undibacterium sp. YM2 TaxID=2058625 RepID=UPI001331F1FC|nr:DUF1398 family protein [Undibacterium sp. YM2]BBB66122.1 hypothetical protein UNDYM_1869 [Undibacterium sp. YM2]
MENSVLQTIEAVAHDSYAGKLTFGHVVGSLMAVGVESYFADYRAGNTSYYMADGSVHVVALGKKDHPIPMAFDAGALVEAIRGAQRDEVRYPEFIRLSMEAGCVGYIVWMAGRHVSYFGHAGEVHVERFPGAD